MFWHPELKWGPELNLVVLQYKDNSCRSKCMHCILQPHSNITFTSGRHVVLKSDIKLLTISNLKLCFFAFYDCFIIVWWNVSRTTCYLFDAAVLYKNLFAALNFTFYDFLVDLFSPNLVEQLSNHLLRVHISLHWRFIEVKLTRPFFNPKVKRHTSIHKTVRSQ